MSDLETALPVDSHLGSPSTRERPIEWRQAALSFLVRRWQVLAATVLLGVGLGIRLYVAYISKGSNDIMLWLGFAAVLEDHGVKWAWANIPLYNHPPLIGHFAVLALKAQNSFGIRFEIFFKLLPILADLVTGIVLYRIWERRAGRGLLAAGAFALSLVSVLVTGYHGNTDSAVAACILLAAYKFEEGHPFVAGLALGAGINIKLVPVLCLPVLAARSTTWKTLLWFVAGLAIAALPFAYYGVTAGPLLYRKVIAYKSFKSQWGLYGLADMAAHARTLARFTKGWPDLLWKSGKNLPVFASFIVAGIAFYDRHRKRWSTIELSAVSMSAFLVVTCGFGVQYTIYPLALLIAANIGIGFVYGTLAGLFIMIVYMDFYKGQTPFYSFFDGPFATASMPFMAMSWLVLAYAVVTLLRRRHRFGMRNVRS